MAEIPPTARVDWSGQPAPADHSQTMPVFQPVQAPQPLSYSTPVHVSARYRVSWAFAIVAMIAGILAWVFDVAWLTSHVSLMGIVGFLLALASGICVFIGELIVAPDPRPSWFKYAAWLSLSSVLFVAFVTVLTR
jgi:hypothetical protein